MSTSSKCILLQTHCHAANSQHLVTMNPHHPRFAFNPDGRWFYPTDPDRRVCRIIRVRQPGTWQLTTTTDIGRFNDQSRAGLEWDKEEMDLKSIRSEERYAIVVGELLLDEAASPDSLHFVPFSSTNSPVCLQRQSQVIWPTGRRYCVIVRLIGSANNCFYILADKNPATKICTLRNTPKQWRIRRYIAIYDEWGGHCFGLNIRSIRRYVKDEIQQVCNILLVHFDKHPRSDAPTMAEFPTPTGCGHLGHESSATPVNQQPAMLQPSRQLQEGEAKNNVIAQFISAEEHTAAQFSPSTDIHASTARIFDIEQACSQDDVQEITAHLNVCIPRRNELKMTNHG